MGSFPETYNDPFLGNCPPTTPLTRRNTYFSLAAKCWLRGTPNQVIFYDFNNAPYGVN